MRPPPRLGHPQMKRTQRPCSLRTIADLRERGVEVADPMGHPEFMDISELATAAGLDTWSLFLQATASSTSVGSYRE